MEMIIEYMGMDEEIYSTFHCDLYTITFVQDGQGELISFGVETDDQPLKLYDQ